MKQYIDELKYVIKGETYVINKYISIYNPTIDEILLFGERMYWSVLNLFVRKPYDIAVELFDKGVDYQSITDWDLFYLTAPSIPIEYTCILFGKLDFTKFGKYIDTETNMKILIHKDNPEIRIDEPIYKMIAAYLRYIHFISEKVEYDVGNKMAKKFLIDRMRRKQQKEQKDFELGKTKPRSQIGDMIKFCVNSKDFKYNYETVMTLTLSLLYESYFFIVNNSEREQVLSGIYHGTIDTSKMKDKSILNVIPDLHK